MAFEHKSVLLQETIEGLNIKPDGIYVDGTLGGGGHAYEVCRRLSNKGSIVGIDQDDAAIEAADIVLMKSELRDVPAAIRLSRQTLRNIRENLFWAFFYNCIGIPLAAGVLVPVTGISLSPMFAAAAMSLSSFCVVTNALRLNLFRVGSAKRDRKKHAKPMPDFMDGFGNTEPDGSAIIKNKEERQMIKTLDIEGMMCAHCQAHVQKALEGVAGVTQVTVSLEEKKATVTADTAVEDQKLIDAVTQSGYQVTACREGA